MSGCVRCRPLAHLSQQACGCMSEIEGQICSRSFKPVRRPRRTFWCARPKIGALQESEDEISYSLTQARSWSEPSEPSVRGSRQAWAPGALDAAPAGLWADDALATAP